MNTNTPLQGGALALPFTKAADPEKRGEVNRKDAALRLPYARRLPDSVRNHRHCFRRSWAYVGLRKSKSRRGEDDATREREQRDDYHDETALFLLAILTIDDVPSIYPQSETVQADNDDRR
ncbi:Aquaporin-1 [Elasticomyces elasticus]|nr:Aquaporin-1 [Elasticomyces elasticus]KAK3641908.1 Aquaporin-1 [Elasticomyces elasticus]KAK4905931.1 Aquaporin-1 [Elasticomyces elasticus]KAK5757497.1 Aquaporin-1 [Elasticomyces elasticus]